MAAPYCRVTGLHSRRLPSGLIRRFSRFPWPVHTAIWGRHPIAGPGLHSTNVALMKNFPFSHREVMYLQFRTEAFSVFNTPIFSSPVATLGSSLGKITSTSGGDRHLQFALKLV